MYNGQTTYDFIISEQKRIREKNAIKAQTVQMKNNNLKKINDRTNNTNNSNNTNNNSNINVNSVELSNIPAPETEAVEV